MQHTHFLSSSCCCFFVLLSLLSLPLPSSLCIYLSKLLFSAATIQVYFCASTFNQRSLSLAWMFVSLLVCSTLSGLAVTLILLQETTFWPELCLSYLNLDVLLQFKPLHSWLYCKLWEKERRREKILFEGESYLLPLNIKNWLSANMTSEHSWFASVPLFPTTYTVFLFLSLLNVWCSSSGSLSFQLNRNDHNTTTVLWRNCSVPSINHLGGCMRFCSTRI